MNWDLTQPQATLIGGTLGGVLLVVAAVIAFGGQMFLIRRERERSNTEYLRQSHEDMAAFLLRSVARTHTARLKVDAGDLAGARIGYATSLDSDEGHEDLMRIAAKVGLSVSHELRATLGKATSAMSACHVHMDRITIDPDASAAFAQSAGEFNLATMAYMDAARDDLATRSRSGA